MELQAARQQAAPATRSGKAASGANGSPGGAADCRATCGAASCKSLHAALAQKGASGATRSGRAARLWWVNTQGLVHPRQALVDQHHGFVDQHQTLPICLLLCDSQTRRYIYALKMSARYGAF